MDTKTCTACKVELPATREIFSVDKRNPDGLGARCRKCERTRLNEHHRLHPEKSRKWREDNAEHVRQKKHADYLKNIEEHNRKTKEYYETHKERAAEVCRQWKKDNPDKLRVISHNRYTRIKLRHSELTRRWKREHRDERNVQWQARRAMILSLPCTLTKDQWIEVVEHFDNKCCYCGEGAKLTQDHFVPVSLGGGYTKENILPCCPTCNSSKANKNFFDWYPKNQNYSPEREQKIVQYIGINKTGCITLPAYG